MSRSKKILALMCLSLGSLATANSQSTNADAIRLSIPSEGFSLPIPSGWQQVPESTFDTAIMRMSQNASGMNFRRPIAVIQRSPLSPDAITYPYILVSAIDSGRLTIPDLKTLAARFNQQAGAKLESNSKGLIKANPSVGYDEQRLRVTGAFLENVGKVGDVATYMELVPTKTGAIVLSGYLLNSTATSAQQFYRPIFASVSLDAEHSYASPGQTQPRHQQFDWTSILLAALVGAFLSLAFGISKSKKGKTA